MVRLAYANFDAGRRTEMTNPFTYLRQVVRRIRQYYLWRDIALVYGWNELAKMQDILGQKMFCRMESFVAEERVRKTGLATIPRNRENPVIITVDSNWRTPAMQFRESDYELMRKALAEHDAK